MRWTVSGLLRIFGNKPTEAARAGGKEVWDPGIDILVRRELALGQEQNLEVGRGRNLRQDRVQKDGGSS